MKIDACNYEDNLFDDKSVIVNCTLDLDNDNKYKIKAMIDNDCIDYSFIDTDIAHKVCELLRIEFLQLNKSREVKNYDERRNKDITHVIYSFMIIQDHTKSCISMMITKLDQHSIILDKSWMKKHEVNYHEHDDSIFFYSDHCTHLKISERFYSNQTKKKDFFSKEKRFLFERNLFWSIEEQNREQKNKDFFEKDQ